LNGVKTMAEEKARKEERARKHEIRVKEEPVMLEAPGVFSAWFVVVGLVVLLLFGKSCAHSTPSTSSPGVVGGVTVAGPAPEPQACPAPEIVVVPSADRVVTGNPSPAVSGFKLRYCYQTIRFKPPGLTSGSKTLRPKVTALIPKTYFLRIIRHGVTGKWEYFP